MTETKRVVILGGGFAGLRVLAKLRKVKGVEVVLIDARETSLMKPALPEVALSGKCVEHVRIPLEPVVKRAGGRFVHQRVERVLPAERRVSLGDGVFIDYDYLVVAAGARKAFDALPGFHEYAYSPCTDHEAPRLAKAFEEFDGGPIVIGAANTTWGERVKTPLLAAPCEGPIAEMMFMIDHELRRRHMRDEATIRVFSPGKVFFEDVGPQVHAAAEPLIEKAGIEVVTQKRIAAIHRDEVEFEDGERWGSTFTVVIPPYVAHPFVTRSPGLGDERGFVPTDEQMRHLDFPEIFAAGDGTSLAMPKLGHIAIHQADIAAASLKRELTGEGEIPAYAPEVFCIVNQGGHQATLINSNHLFGGDVDRAFTSPLAHMMKWSFDSYYFHSHGHLPPDASEEAMLKLFS